MTPMTSDARMRALRWLFWVQMLSMGAMEMSGPFWPLHLRDLGGLSGSELAKASALAYAGPLFMAMCCTPIWGRLADRFGHKPMVLRALLALVLTQAWIAMADSVASVLWARLVQGALAGFIAAAQAYGAQLSDPTRRAQMIAKLQVATAIGAVFGPFVGGLLYQSTGFATINFIATGIGAVCAAMAWLALPPTPASATKVQGKRSLERTAPGVEKARAAVVGLLLGIVAVQTARMMPQAFFGLYAEQVLLLPAWATGVCYGATALGLCIGAPVWARRFDNLGKTRVLGEAAIVSGLCALLTLAQTPAVPFELIMAARLLWGIALGALLPVFYALLSREAPNEAQGRVLAGGNAAAKAGALVGTGLGGLAIGLLPLSQLMWPVALAYAMAGTSLYCLQRTARPKAMPASRASTLEA